MDERHIHGTFFVLGWVAQRCPDLVRRIAEAGHEVACHGQGHELLDTLTPDEFREDIRKSKGILEDISSRPVRGYRAPSFSITEWAIDVLRDEGFCYDSSYFPSLSHDRYGSIKGVSGNASLVEIRPEFFELPISTLRLGFGGDKGIPWGGGGYFRLIPYNIFRTGVRSILRQGRAYVFYIHPWEIDPGQPRMRVNWSHALRHYANLEHCEGRFARLLDDFRWTPLDQYVQAHR